jgi:hypothetical protein
MDRNRCRIDNKIRKSKINNSWVRQNLSRRDKIWIRGYISRIEWVKEIINEE